MEKPKRLEAPVKTVSGLGVPCTEAQADGVPCLELRPDCDGCERTPSPTDDGTDRADKTPEP